MIFDKVAAYTSRLVAFNGHPSTCGCLTGFRKNRPVNFGSGAGKHFLPLCAYVAGFGNSNHIHIISCCKVYTRKIVIRMKIDTKV